MHPSILGSANVGLRKLDRLNCLSALKCDKPTPLAAETRDASLPVAYEAQRYFTALSLCDQCTHRHIRKASVVSAAKGIKGSNVHKNGLLDFSRRIRFGL